VDLHLGAAVLAEQHHVAHVHLEGTVLAILEDLAVADGDDAALDRLLLGRVGDDDPALGGVLALEALDDDPILQLPDFHGSVPPLRVRHRRLPRSGPSGAVSPGPTPAPWGARRPLALDLAGG